MNTQDYNPLGATIAIFVIFCSLAATWGALFFALFMFMSGGRHDGTDGAVAVTLFFVFGTIATLAAIVLAFAAGAKHSRATAAWMEEIKNKA